MMSAKNKLKPHSPSLTIAIVFFGLAMVAPAHAELTGNIGVVSKYVLRGITNNTQNNTATVQGGFDYAHSSGVYVGYGVPA